VIWVEGSSAVRSTSSSPVSNALTTSAIESKRASGRFDMARRMTRSTCGGTCVEIVVGGVGSSTRMDAIIE
jgi:hypothetical protein